MVCSRSNSDLVKAYTPFLYIISSSLLLSESSGSSAELSVYAIDDHLILDIQFDKRFAVHHICSYLQKMPESIPLLVYLSRSPVAVPLLDILISRVILSPILIPSS